MKKLNILAVSALVATIGGVYATWTYASKEATADDVTVGVSVANQGEGTEKGTIIVTGNVQLVIDDTNGDYIAELVVADGSENLTITFTAADSGADADVIENGIVMEYVITVEGYTYKNASIFTVSDTATVLNKGDATFEATITAQEICNAITISEIVLDTEAKYDAFTTGENKLTVGTITVSVREKIEETV